MLRKSEVLAGPELEPGSVYAFVPAHGESRVGAVQQPLSRIWTEDLGLSVLLADFDGAQSSLWQPMSELRNLDAYTRGALVRREQNVEMLNAAGATVHDVAEWMASASRRYDVVAADLSKASEEIGIEVMRVATSIFIVSDSDLASLELAREKAAWIRGHGWEDVALLMRSAAAGMRADLAEDFTGVPVCSLVDSFLQMQRLASWLAVDTRRLARAAC